MSNINLRQSSEEHKGLCGQLYNSTDENGDWDGDDGYDVEIEIAEEKLHRDIAEMIFEDYIKCLVDEDMINYSDDDTSERNVYHAIEKVVELIDDIDCWDKATKFYYDALKEKYQEDYDNE